MMKGVSEIDISFEFFPPKTLEGIKNLKQTANELAKFQPEFFSVTFGAGGSTREGTINAVKMLYEQTKMIVAPHIACMGATQEELLTILSIYKQMGIDRIVALRGDLPKEGCVTSELLYASQLVKLIRDFFQDDITIAVAAYPEIHPQANNAFADLANLKRKYEAGADVAITQYFFNPDAFFYFRDECVENGIHMPLIPGIMPITQFTNLKRFSAMCGAEVPRWIYKRLEAYGEDLASIQAFGLDVVSNLCEQLLTGGVEGIHFYTLNKAEPTCALLARLMEISRLRLKVQPAVVGSLAVAE